MSTASQVTPLRSAAQPDWEGNVGHFQVEVRGGDERGTLVLRPPDGDAVEIRLEAGLMTIRYEGPGVQLTAPEAHLELAAKSIALSAEETIEVHGGKEVDIHSGVDVEVRADHHVNLWGHGVNVGD
jgi:hypothetical protein